MNCSPLFVVADVDAGKTVIELTTGVGEAVVTVTLADPDLVVSATLTAVTESVPAFAGAVYAPDGVIVPSTAFHVTAVFDVAPCTLAVKGGSVPPVVEEAVAGVTVTDVTAGPEGVGLGADGEVTVTTAEADLVGSATLVAVTIPVAAVAGAV